MWTVIFILIQFMGLTMGIIGYDCRGGDLNITPINLKKIDDCNIPRVVVNSTQVYVQLLQLLEFGTVRIYQCKVEVSRTVQHYGWKSYLSSHPNEYAEYIMETGMNECLEMHSGHSYKWRAKTVIDNLKPNQTTIHSMVFAGSVDSGANFAGVEYSDPYGTYKNSTVQGELRISLRDYYAKVGLHNGKIVLNSGVTCNLEQDQCLDVEGGYTYWEPLKADSCGITKYGKLYTGVATRISDATGLGLETVYTVSTNGTTFALASANMLSICGYKLIRTEHPKLLILETSKGQEFTATGTSVENMDLFTYANEKFVYTERHTRMQMGNLYRDVLIRRCNLQRQDLKILLLQVENSPAEVAAEIMGHPGYMAVKSCEVLYLIKCIPCDVTIRRTKFCYKELPVWKGNESWFLTSKTHMIIKNGNQVPCNEVLSSMFQLGERWYKLTPYPVETIPPMTLKLLSKATWSYVKPGDLAASGIYTQESLNNLRDHIMFPVERPAIINTIANRAMGKTVVSPQGMSMSNLLDEEALNNIASNTWDRVWSGFMGLGTASAGIIGIVLICRFIKFLIDTIIHGYALYTMYGWSLYLLGAIWDSETNLLLHLGRRRPREPEREMELTIKN